jgi:hypothetical protein
MFVLAMLKRQRVVELAAERFARGIPNDLQGALLLGLHFADRLRKERETSLSSAWRG